MEQEQKYTQIAEGMVFQCGGKYFRCVKINNCRAHCVAAVRTINGTATYSDYGSIDISPESWVVPVAAAELRQSNKPFGGHKKKKVPFNETPIGALLVERPRTLAEICEALGRTRASVYSSLWSAQRARYVVKQGEKYALANVRESTLDPLGANK